MNRRPLDIALVVDARELTSSLFPSDDPSFFVEQWNRLEPRLRGKQLQSGVSLQVQSDLGQLRFEVVQPATPVRVTESTAFGVVAVREAPSVRAAYRCSECRRLGRETYGPFICSACDTPDSRVCDEHVVVLPGAIGKAACPQHRPVCRDCGARAAARCPGRRCGGDLAWCSQHLHAHSSDPETRYCRHCYDERFPACGARGCSGIGSIPCDHVEATGRPCGEKRCPRHARQWQVFGPHRDGLGRCDRHFDLSRLGESELLYQVLAGCVITKNSAPSLLSLRHILLKARRTAIEPRGVLQLAEAVPREAPALRGEIATLVQHRAKAWQEAAAAAADQKDEALRQVQAWLSQYGFTNALHGLTATSWVKPRDERPGRVYVRCDPRHFPRHVRDKAAAALGFEIWVEKNQ